MKIQYYLWRLDTQELTLTYEKEDIDYELDLTEFTSSTKILNAILICSEKAYISPESIGHLITFLGDVFYVQSRYYMGGIDTEIEPKQLIKQYEKFHTDNGMKNVIYS